ETREQGKGVGRRAGESGENAVVVQTSNLAGALLDDGLAKRDLPIARHHGSVAVSDGENGGAVNHGLFLTLSTADPGGKQTDARAPSPAMRYRRAIGWSHRSPFRAIIKRPVCT